MKELVVVSGKGGTGKTSLVASFASLGGNLVLADCDVDASNLPLLLEPNIELRVEFRAGYVARIRPELCMACGVCHMLCRFDAVREDDTGSAQTIYSIDPTACEGCGVCARACLEKAIELNEKVCGEWFASRTRHGSMVHARLGVAAENSGKLVFQIRAMARKLAGENDVDLVIVDGSPGIGCPVIASITGCDLVLAVTEPTLSGLHDLERIVGLARHFKLPVAVAVNKFDLNESLMGRIEKYCRENELTLVGKIPYSEAFTEAMLAGQSIVEYGNGKACDAVEAIWAETQSLLMKKKRGEKK